MYSITSIKSMALAPLPTFPYNFPTFTLPNTLPKIEVWLTLVFDFLFLSFLWGKERGRGRKEEEEEWENSVGLTT